MGKPIKPEPGRLVISVISSSMDAVADTLSVLERKFGRVEFETIEIATTTEKQYREEMGDNLYRRFFSFERSFARDSLPDIKATCSKIEPMFADQVGDYIFRTANIDPGLLSAENLIMAHYTPRTHHVYLRDGVFAELSLAYSQGQFMQLPWTSEDFCDPEAIDFFGRVRSAIVPETDDSPVVA